MNGAFIIIALIAAAAVLFLLIAKLASFLSAFTEDVRTICYKIDCADSYGEYRRRRHELRCRYLCLIPFVNKRNVRRVYRSFFYKGDHLKKKERRDGIVPLLMPSVLGIGICMVCVCGMTWAWYSASVRTPAQKLTAAYYEVSVESVMNGTDGVVPTDGGYDLKAGTAYTVVLKAAGTAGERGGYCLIENENGTVRYYTEAFKPQEQITVVFTPGADGRYTFTGVWGSQPVNVTEENILKSTDQENRIHAAAEEPDMSAVTGNATPNPVPAGPSAEPEISAPTEQGDIR